MKKASLSQCEPISPGDDFIMIPLFGPETKPNQAVHIGFVEFKPGVRMPAQGVTSHDCDEFSYFLSGKLSCTSGGKTKEYQAGDAIYVPAGESHYSQNTGDEPCRLIYMLVKTI